MTGAQQMATTATADYMKIGDGKVYYEMAGEGEVLLLNHAGFVDSGMWNGQWDEFAQHYQVIRYDMRGYGKSDPVKAPVSRRDDLRQLLDHLGAEQAYLLGCSMGGEIILDFTLEHPDRVAALIVVSATPSAFELQGEPPRYMMEMMEAFQKGETDKVSDLQIRIWVDGMYREPEQVDAKVRKHAAAMNRIPVQNKTWAADMQPLNPLDPPAVGRLNEIRVPTLIIDGALDHPEILRAGDVMQSSIRGAQKIVIPDTAHVPNMEKPAAFNRAVLDFLRGIDQ